MNGYQEGKVAGLSLAGVYIVCLLLAAANLG